MSNEIYRLKHIIEAIENIWEFTSNLHESEFKIINLHDKKTWFAICYNFIINGEHVKKLYKKLVLSYPNINWSKSIGMRNIMAHNFAKIDTLEVWNVLNGEQFNLLYSAVKKELAIVDNKEISQ